MPKKRAPKKSPARKKAKKPAARKAAAKGKSKAKKPAARKAKASPAKPAARKRPSKRKSKTFAELEGLIELMVEKEVVEVEFEETGSRWRVRRAEAHAVAYSAPAPAAIPAMPAVPAPQPAGGEAAPAVTSAPAEPQGEVFQSPMVGTFYRAPSPDAEPFCKPGDNVASDRTICIIEAMKVMNEIKAEREFEIVDILVKDGESVEFGQPLFLIR